MDYQIRLATLEDLPVLQSLIARSARELSAKDYAPEVVEGALRGAFGVDTQLIKDGTYFVIECGVTECGAIERGVIERGGAIAACGGWSYRRTLFGSDQRAERDSSELDPAVDAAKIRAFFVDPAHARRGLGTQLLDKCESAARARGFTRVELMGTLPGVRLYAARGYVATGQVSYEVSPGLAIDFVPMAKPLGSTCR